MKILHTADWHLGHRLHEQSQIEEQILFLNWIENYIIDQKIEIDLEDGVTVNYAKFEGAVAII
jgi:exonuclease SbcD